MRFKYQSNITPASCFSHLVWTSVFPKYHNSENVYKLHFQSYKVQIKTEFFRISLFFLNEGTFI